MIELKCEQRSDEWYAARIGVCTASAVKDLLSSSGKYTYVNKIISEKLTGIQESIPINSFMQHGMDFEDEARITYEKVTGNKVTEIGFVFKDESRLAGCSPDGLVGDDGLMEIKCPSSKVHVQNLRKGPAKMYKDQMQFQMYCTGRKWCDFVSYDPRVKDESMRLYVERINIDPGAQITIHQSLQWLNDQVNTFFSSREVSRSV